MTQFTELMDDLEALAAESTQTAKADEVEDLSDLDDLLNESIEIADAKRALRKGQKVSADQLAALEANGLAKLVNRWITIKCFAHLCDVQCTCGNTFVEFRGWYHFEKHSHGEVKRLVCQAEPAPDVPQLQYRTHADTNYCPHCTGHDLPLSGADPDLLELLGNPQHPDKCECQILLFEDLL